MARFDQFLIPSTLSNITDTEAYLESVCNEYGLDYENLDKENTNEIEFVQEGILSDIFKGIKSFFTKVIQFLVKIWRNLVDFVKKIINWVVSKVKKLFGNKDDKEVITKVKLIVSFCMEATEIPEGFKEYNNIEELQRAFKKSIDKISNEIKIQSKKNIDFMKRYEKITSNRMKATESAILLERVIYNDRPVNLSDADMSDFTKRFINAALDYNDTVYFGGDIYTQMNLEKIDTMNIEGLKRLKEAGDNIMRLYKQFKEDTIDNICNAWLNSYKKSFIDYTPDATNLAMHKILKAVAEMQSLGYTDSEIYKLGEAIFPEFESASDLQRWVNLKINFNEGLIATLKDMIIINYNIFDISSKEALRISNQLGNNDFSGIRKIFYDNFEKFHDPNRNQVDLRELGLGILCYSKGIAGIGGGKNFFELYNRTDISDRLLTLLYKYDIVIDSHGSHEFSNLGDMYREANAVSNQQRMICEKLYQKQFDFYENDLGISKQQLLNMAPEEEVDRIIEYRESLGMKYLDIFTFSEFKDDINKNKKSFGLQNSHIESKVFEIERSARWKCQPIITPAGYEFNDIEFLIYELMQEGFKNIFITSCNTRRIVLNNEIRKSSKVLVTMSTRATLG